MKMVECGRERVNRGDDGVFSYGGGVAGYGVTGWEMRWRSKVKFDLGLTGIIIKRG